MYRKGPLKGLFGPEQAFPGLEQAATSFEMEEYSYICWHALPTNWCHGLSAESENCRPVGLHHSEAERWRRSQNRHFCPLVAPIL